MQACESFAVVGFSGLVLASAAVGRPGQGVPVATLDGQHEFGVKAPDFVGGQRDQAVLAVACGGAPFAAWSARVMVRNAAAANARVMWAYQAS